MSVFNGSPKAYAVSLGLCSEGRGRMNQAALDAVSKARSAGMTFSGEKVVKPRAAKKDRPVRITQEDEPVKKGSVIPQTEYDIRKVRTWAQSQGIPVSDRGRISAEVKEAYGEANPDEEKVEKSVNGGKDLRQSAPRTSPPGSQWQTEISGKSYIVSEKVCCANCGVSLGWHTCLTPRAVVGSGDLVYVTRVGG